MPRPMGKIRIMLSSRVLLDLEQADALYREKGVEEYAHYMSGTGPYEKDFDAQAGGRLLKPGPLFAFAMAAAKLNQGQKEPVVELGIVCKDDVDSAMPIFRSLDLNGLDNVEFRMSTAGHPLSMADHRAFGTDLLLTRNAGDAQMAINNGIAAAVINFPPEGGQYERVPADPIRLWVDGDAVVFGSSAEVRFRREGLDTYRRLEKEEFNKSIEPGPFTSVLAKISTLNSTFPRGQEPFEISLLTARGGDAAARIFTIAKDLGVKFNGRMYFMGGAGKAGVLKEHKPDLYLDDQMVHLKESMNYCPTGLVAYAEGSPMHEFMKEQEAKAAAEAAAKPVTLIAANKADIVTPPAANENEPKKCAKPGCAGKGHCGKGPKPGL